MSGDSKHEIVIIRRGGHGDHDDHHGGVWKIAFADFMTAMMAFFLVMWLISANDKTRASVARYFNPVRLVDATTQPRGLHDPKKDDSGITASPDTKEIKGTSKEMKERTDKKTEGAPRSETPAGREKRLDSGLRDDPFKALAEIAAVRGASDSPPKEAQRASAPVIGRKGGSEFRDPFAPPRMDPDAKDLDPLGIASAPATPRAEPVPIATRDAADPNPSSPDAVPSKDADLGADAVQQLSSQLKTSARDGGAGLDVRRTKEGLLVSLTDTEAFSMFANGSAVPARRVVTMMERIAKVLATKPGEVIIRGFTDNKRFRSKRYDNWNLSVDRAQSAHYMLVRGGLADARIVAVEGFADRRSKPGVDPGSPLNRRIEILLKEEGR